MAQTDKAAPGWSRPAPPEGLVDPELLMLGVLLLRPAPEIGDCIQRAILADDGPLHNPDHAHLIDADVAFLGASGGFTKQGRTVLGQAEQVMFRGGGWQTACQEQQMVEWFGRVPAFLITLAADYCAACSDAEFCALVEHELYHIGQELDEFDAPKFRKDGPRSWRCMGTTSRSSSEWSGATGQARTCGVWWTRRPSRQRSAISTLQGRAGRAYGSLPEAGLLNDVSRSS